LAKLQDLDQKIFKENENLDFSQKPSLCLTLAVSNAQPNTPVLANLEDLAQEISPNFDQDILLPSSSTYPTIEIMPHSSQTERLEEQLIREAQKQEANLKEETEDLDFSLPSTSRLTLGEIKAQQNAPSLASLENLAKKISPNLDLDFSLPSSSDEYYLKEEGVNADERKIENIQETNAKGAVRINQYHGIPTGYVRDKDRKKRQNKAAEELKRLVPGLEPKSKESKVCEMTIKYIEFMKTHVGPDVDEEFLMNQIF
jgi:hypothetical protein